MSNIVKHTEFKKVVNALWNKVKENFVTEVKYDSTSKKLKYTKNGADTDITNVVTKWGDLEHTQHTPIRNIFDKNDSSKIRKDEYFCIQLQTMPTFIPDPAWDMTVIPCQANEVFTVVKSQHDSGHTAFIESDNFSGRPIAFEEFGRKEVNGYVVYKITVPSNTNIKFFTVNMYKQHLISDTLMVFKGDIQDSDIPKTYYPYLNDYRVMLDGTEVGVSFNTAGTNLQSFTVVEAIKELDSNVTTNGTNIQTIKGELNNKVNTSQIGNTAGKIPQIENDGKLATSIMPALAITEVFVVPDEQAMMSQNVQVGDVVVVENEDNTSYMCKNAQASAKLDKFVPINTGLSVVKQVNTKKPDPTGAVTLDGTHINATVGGHKDTIQNHLQTANNNIDAANNNINSINGVVSSLSRDVSTVTSDLGNVKRTINNHNTRISNLESKKHGVKVGEVISTLNTTLGESYAIDGVTFLYIGREKLISRNNYPQLSEALGIPSGVNNFNTPVIADSTFRYDHNSRTATRKHYIVAKM